MIRANKNQVTIKHKFEIIYSIMFSFADQWWRQDIDNFPHYWLFMKWIDWWPVHYPFKAAAIQFFNNIMENIRVAGGPEMP